MVIKSTRYQLYFNKSWFHSHDIFCSRPNGNFKGSSNSMEIKRTKFMFKTLQQRGIVDQIDAISNDRDNKNKHYRLSIKNAFDSESFGNSFKKALTKMINDNKIFRYVNNENEEVVVNHQYDLLERLLLRWFNTCFKEKMMINAFLCGYQQFFIILAIIHVAIMMKMRFIMYGCKVFCKNF